MKWVSSIRLYYSKLEETAIQMAENLTQRPIRSLVGIKRPMNYTMKDIQYYLDFESFELLRTIGV